MDRKILDVHAHIFPEKIACKAVEAIGRFYELEMYADGSATELLREGRISGVTRFVVHSVATTPAQVASINRFIWEETGYHPELIGFATLHPYMDQMEEEIELALSSGMKGIKLHPDFQQFQLDEPRAMKMFRLLAGQLPVLVHTGDSRYDYSSPLRMARVMDAVPGLRLIAAHFGGYSQWLEAKKNLLGRDLYIDTSSSLFALEPEEAVDMIRLHGSEKTLFGTDYPMWTLPGELERFYRLPLTESEQNAILWDNGAKLLGL